MEKELITVKIEKIVPNGYGLGFADGLTVFVNMAARGDIVRVRPYQRKKRTAFAEIVEVVEPSPDRVNPLCEYYGKCGGCDLQHISYEAQLQAKQSIVEDCLKRLGRIEFEGAIEVVPSPIEWHYRSRAQWHGDTVTRKLGYFRRGSHEVFDIDACRVLAPELDALFESLKARISWDELWSEKPEIEVASAGAKTSIFSTDLIEPTEWIVFEAAGERYAYDAECFFQGNLQLVPNLIECATAGFAGRRAIDLFCGVGLFTLPLARAFESVTGIEGSQRSIDYARENASAAGLHNVQFFASDAADWVAENAEGLKDADLILLDPPRAGASRELLEGLIAATPAAICYVSCDPATLARDLSVLCAERYEVAAITVLDMFPQTHHVETVVRLSSKS